METARKSGHRASVGGGQDQEKGDGQQVGDYVSPQAAGVIQVALRGWEEKGRRWGCVGSHFSLLTVCREREGGPAASAGEFVTAVERVNGASVSAGAHWELGKNTGSACCKCQETSQTEHSNRDPAMFCQLELYEVQ